MLLAVSTTHAPATDLGFLLHKNPDRVQTFDLSFGQAPVFYPDAPAESPKIWTGCAPGQSTRVHECVFGVLALESEPIDPRL